MKLPGPAEMHADFPIAFPVAAPARSPRAAIEVEVVPLPSLATLQDEWRALEGASDASFFVSWHWIGAWLAALPDDVGRLLVRARSNRRTVGLAVFCTGERRRGPITTRALFLHATGRPDLDELTVEYNGILMDRTLEAEVLSAIIGALHALPEWDEIYLDGWHRNDLLGCLEQPGTRLLCEQRRPFRYVDLAALRNAGHAYLAGVASSKLRQNVRRTLRECEVMGGMRFIVARDADEALEFLADLKRLHEKAWKAKGQPTAFSKAFFQDFHAGLVRQGMAGGFVQIARLAAGERAIGYVYSFLHRGRVYAYQTGFDFEAATFSVWSPGLATHALAIEHNRDCGHEVYDLMAGESRYKKDLAECSGSMDWLILQRPKITLRVYDGMRVAWSRMQGWSRKAQASPPP